MPREIWTRDSEKLNVTPKSAYIFIGPPTSGKTNQVNFFSGITSGTVLRGRDILPDLAEVKAKKRELVEDEQFIPALEVALYSQTASKIFLENIPRTKKQAELVVKWARDLNVDLHVVELTLSLEEAIYRSSNRMACPHCGESYHPELKPSVNDGFCDRDGNQLVKREGDKPELIITGYKRSVQTTNQIIGTLSSVATIHKIPASGKVSESVERTKNKLFSE